MAIDRDDALRKAEKLLRQGRLDGAIAEYEHVVDAYPGRHRHGVGPGRPLRARRQGAAGRRAVHAPRRPLPQGRRPGQGGGQLPQGPQARSRSRGRAPPAGRGLRAAGPAGRRQDAPPGGDREAQGARRPGRRRHARHPPRRARPQRLRGPPAGGRRSASAPARSSPPTCWRWRKELDSRKRDERGRGAARGSRQARSGRHRGVAAPGQGRARPRRGGARQALPARHARQPRIRSCCSPAARSC